MKLPASTPPVPEIVLNNELMVHYLTTNGVDWNEDTICDLVDETGLGEEHVR